MILLLQMQGMSFCLVRVPMNSRAFLVFLVEPQNVPNAVIASLNKEELVPHLRQCIGPTGASDMICFASLHLITVQCIEESILCHKLLDPFPSLLSPITEILRYLK